jgi:hypothetical protein
MIDSHIQIKIGTGYKLTTTDCFHVFCVFVPTSKIEKESENENIYLVRLCEPLAMKQSGSLFFYGLLCRCTPRNDSTRSLVCRARNPHIGKPISTSADATK